MRIWSSERRENAVRSSTYYGSALFVVFSLIVLGTAYVLQDMRVFAASFAVGAAVIAIMCYVALVSTISKRAKRIADVGSPCGYATDKVIGVCPDTHVEDDGMCKRRSDRIDIGSDSYTLGENVEPTFANDEDRKYLEMQKLEGMSTDELVKLCRTFNKKPYTALNTMGRACVRD